ncbi:MAG: hypothetical protein J7604_14415 [Sporocytophaga sp.]|uniref:hypothetical protein n=1 Tax=Sporocytophaga sp. TaxID=2231183 RepID=UPI001B0720E7|nr:hypothetical protein [Sporocytophaga sp.]MBO9701399.1 hypothetical protein [Sporocytophaga sp.]
MKQCRIYFILLFLLPFIKVAGQTVSIPDANLKAFILEKFPAVLDSSQNLKIADAAQIPGTFNCSGRNIKNAEGIQYFTNVYEINLSNNQLSFLPEMPSLPKLMYLSVSDNQIYTLPSLDGLKGLIFLDVRRNKLKTLPDLSKNVALNHLNVHSNEIEILPNLDALVNLTYLNVALNKLIRLPDLRHQSNLTSLICWENELEELPSLDQLNNLILLDASKNKITRLPPFSSESKIENLYIDRNIMDSLPDFSVYKHLKTVRLYGNRLTFQDIVPLTSIDNFDTIFLVTPQTILKVGKNIDVLETEKVILKTGIDTAISGVIYEWICNGQMIRSSSEDTISASTVITANTGYYYCNIIHPAFPGLVLQTDSFFVKVLPCINLSDFSTIVTSTTCMKAGSLIVSAYNQPYSNLFYILTSISTGKIFTSSNGVFKDLNEPEYRLTVKAGNNCSKQLSNTIYIPKENCKDVFITPNGDGVDDTFFFPQTGTATITDKWGDLVKTFSIPGEWNGTGDSGIVSPGLYLVKINNGEVIKISVVY